MATRVGRRQLSEADVIQIGIDAGFGSSSGSPPVLSVFGRQGNVAAVAGDYSATQINNNSGVAGTFVSDALDQLNSELALKLENVVEDTTPQLGGDLDVNGAAIVSTGSGNIRFTPNGIGEVLVTSAGTANVGINGGAGSEAILTFRRNTSNVAGQILSSSSALTIGTSALDLSLAPGGGSRLLLDGLAFPTTPGAAGQVLAIGSPESTLIWTTPVSGGSPIPVASVFGRQGNVVALASDYNASQIDNDSGVTGAFVDDALNQLNTDLSGKADISATPVNNQLAVWTNSTTIEGDADLTWNGSQLDVADMRLSGNTLQATSGDTQINAPTGQNVDIQYQGISRLVFDGANSRVVLADYNLFIEERAAALPDVSGYGQFWVRNDGTPMFTNDGGSTFELNATGGGGIAGSPVTNVTAGDGLTGGGDGAITLDVDSTVVRTSGNQSIGGTKTFTSTISGSISGNAATASSVPASGISSGNLGSGVLTSVSASATSSSFRIPFLNYSGNASGNYGFLIDNGGNLSYNPSSNTLTSGAFVGGGSALTGLNANNITTGNLPNTRLATMTGNTIKGRTAGSGTPQDISVPANTIVGNSGTVVAALSGFDATQILSTFTSAFQGVVPASGGGTTNFLRADGTWAAPAGGGGNADTLDGLDSSQFLRSDVVDSKTSGNLTFSDNVELQLGSSADARFFSNNADIFCRLANINRFLITDGFNSRFTFQRTTGDFTATGDVTANSDIRIKENLEPIVDGLEKVEQLTGYTYNRTDREDERRHAGVIAQEVEQVLPEVVHEDDDGIKSVAYGNMVGLLIESIKELSAEVKTLKAEIEELKK